MFTRFIYKVYTGYDCCYVHKEYEQWKKSKTESHHEIRKHFVTNTAVVFFRLFNSPKFFNLLKKHREAESGMK